MANDSYQPTRREVITGALATAGLLIPSSTYDVQQDTPNRLDAKVPLQKDKYDIKFEISDRRYTELVSNFFDFFVNQIPISEQVNPLSLKFSGNAEGIKTIYQALRDYGLIKGLDPLDAYLNGLSKSLSADQNYLNSKFTVQNSNQLDANRVLVLYRQDKNNSRFTRLMQLGLEGTLRENGRVEPVALHSFRLEDYNGSRVLRQRFSERYQEHWSGYGSEEISILLRTQSDIPRVKWTNLNDMLKVLGHYSIMPNIDVEGRWAELSQGIRNQNIKI